MSILITFVVIFSIIHGNSGEEAAAGGGSSINLSDEIGFFSKCKGKDITYPSDLITQAATYAAECSLQFGLKVPSKECLATCGAEKFKLIKEDRSYDAVQGRKILTDAKIDPEIVDIQMKVLERCALDKKFLQDEVCAASKEYDACMREGQKTDCA